MTYCERGGNEIVIDPRGHIYVNGFDFVGGGKPEPGWINLVASDGTSRLPRTPRMNAVCERVIGTLRRELLDRILSERQLTCVLRECLIHYNGRWPHQSRQQRPPDIATQPARDATELNDLRSIRRKPVITGTINEYHHAA